VGQTGGEGANRLVPERLVPAEEAFEPWSRAVVDLYLAHWDRLVRLAALLLDDVAESEDIVQDAFVRFNLSRQKRGRLRPIESETAFLTTIVVNSARSSLRRRLIGRRAVADLKRSQGPHFDEGADAAVFAAFERQAMVAALRRLPRRQREAVVLRYYGNFALDDIARMTVVSVGTAKSNLSRGRDALAKVLEDHFGKEGLE
jgi:RNA polymerase sigma factor (sigma-70 family)